MSYKNRLNEYNRLKALNRQKDIPQALLDEFEESYPVPPKPKPKGKK